MLRLFSVLTILSVTVAYKVLVVFPVPGKSHSILGEGYVRALLDAGHEVTYITPFPMKKSHKNLTQIDASSNLEIFKAGSASTDNLNLGKIISKEVALDPSALFAVMTNFSAVTFENTNVKKMLLDPQVEFDAVICEWMFTEAYVGLSSLYNCPFIWAAPMDPDWLILQLIDERSNPAYVSSIIGTSIPPFDFWQRVQELVTMAGMLVVKNYHAYNKDTDIYERAFTAVFKARGRVLPPYGDVLFNASLVFGNSHISLGQAISFPQNYKAIGGYHIDPVVKPLPEDLKKLLDSNKDGFIYFSMGSNLKSKDIPEEIKKGLLQIFGSLKQTVIWKFEEDLPGIPKNVHLLKWAPQQSILAHPNIRLFVSHGGLLSTTETVHFGVPVIGMPVFGDQFVNVCRAVAKGFAKKVDWSSNVIADLKAAIEEILNDPKYTRTVKELSFIYHDRPVLPVQELVHWVRHVIETRGAPHLRSPALKLAWYQKMYLDFAVLVLVMIFAVVKLIKLICCGKKKQEKLKKN